MASCAALLTTQSSPRGSATRSSPRSSAAIVSSVVTCPIVADPARLRGARPPRLALVREPDQLGVEREHPALTFGARLVELGEANRHVAADDDRTPARLDDD